MSSEALGEIQPQQALFKEVLQTLFEVAGIAIERSHLFVCDPGDQLDGEPSLASLPDSAQASKLGLKDSVTAEPIIRWMADSPPGSASLILAPFTSGRPWLKDVAKLDLAPSFGRWRGAESLLDAVVLSMPSDHCVALIVPESILFLQSGKVFRETLRESGLLRCVIERGASQSVFSLLLTRRLFHFPGILCFLDAREKDGCTRFWRMPETTNLSKIPSIVSDLRRLLAQGGGQTSHGFVMREHLPDSEPMSFRACHPDVAKKAKSLEDYGEAAQLSKICELFIGRPPFPGPTEPEGKKPKQPRGPILLRASHITLEGTLDLQNVKYSSEKSSKVKLLKSGDICVSGFLQSGTHNTLRVAELPEDLPSRGLTASSHLWVVRPPGTMSDERRRFLVAYLRSRKAAEFLRVKSHGIHLDFSNLRELPVPIPDEEFERSISELLRAAQVFEEQRVETNQAISDLFNFDKAEDSRLHVLITGRRSRLSSGAARQANDFSYIVRTLFPHPLALRWRRVESSLPDREGYLDTLDCGESLLCYIASLAIVMAKMVDVPIQAVEHIRDRMSKTGRGTNLGDWINIIRQVSQSKSFDFLDTSAALYELAHFVTPFVDSAIQRFATRRNDQSHKKGPAIHELESACTSLRSDIEILFQAAVFLTDYPLIYIEETARDSFAKVTNYKFRRLVGDHALVPVEVGQSASAEIEKGGLYLMDKSGELVNLRPLLLRQACPLCGSWATFHLENFDKKGPNFVVKAFEHSHVMEYRAVEHFDYYGLL